MSRGLRGEVAPPLGPEVDSATLDWLIEQLGTIKMVATILGDELKLVRDPAYRQRIHFVDPPLSPRQQAERDAIDHARRSLTRDFEPTAEVMADAKRRLEAAAREMQQRHADERAKKCAADEAAAVAAREAAAKEKAQHQPTTAPSDYRGTEMWGRLPRTAAKATRATSKRPAKRRRAGVS